MIERYFLITCIRKDLIRNCMAISSNRYIHQTVAYKSPMSRTVLHSAVLLQQITVSNFGKMHEVLSRDTEQASLSATYPPVLVANFKPCNFIHHHVKRF